MSWRNDVYFMNIPQRNETGPIVKMALTSKAYQSLPEDVEGHIAEYLLPKRIPRGTRGLKYRLPQSILRDRRLKKEIGNTGRAYTERAQKREYNKYMAMEGQAQMNAVLAAQRAEFARRQANAAEHEAHRAAMAAVHESLSAPMRPSAERRRQTAKSRARRGQQYNFRPYTHKKSQNKSKKPSKTTRKLRTQARKQKSK